MQFFQTPEAPLPAGHYSQAVAHNGLLFVSGQLAIDPVLRQPMHLPVSEQLKMALSHVKNIVLAAGSTLDKIIKCTVFIADVGLWPEVDKAYADFFGEHKPARSIVPTANLHYGLLIEVEAVAALD